VETLGLERVFVFAEECLDVPALVTTKGVTTKGVRPLLLVNEVVYLAQYRFPQQLTP